MASQKILQYPVQNPSAQAAPLNFTTLDGPRLRIQLQIILIGPNHDQDEKRVGWTNVLIEKDVLTKTLMEALKDEMTLSMLSQVGK